MGARVREASAGKGRTRKRPWRTAGRLTDEWQGGAGWMRRYGVCGRKVPGRRAAGSGENAMKQEEFASLLARAHAHANEFLEDLPERFVGARASRQDMLAALDGPLTQGGEDEAAVLDLLAAQAGRGASACAAPRYFGFVIGGSLPVALAADWLVSTWDQNAGIHVISPLAAALEEVAARWLFELFDLPRDSGVGFVTGCQMAHFTCLAAARHGVLRKAGWDVEADGLNGAPGIHVVASEEAHVTLDVALRYLG